VVRNTVLTIDDDPDFREMIALLLRDLELTCVVAADFASAFSILESANLHLRAVLLDYFMPGIDPRTCIREIVALAGPEVRVVLVSAAADIGARAAEVGLQRFLAKPFDMKQLSAVVLGDD
jgi:two-component system response regulator GlrR